MLFFFLLLPAWLLASDPEIIYTRLRYNRVGSYLEGAEYLAVCKMGSVHSLTKASEVWQILASPDDLLLRLKGGDPTVHFTRGMPAPLFEQRLRAAGLWISKLQFRRIRAIPPTNLERVNALTSLVLWVMVAYWGLSFTYTCLQALQLI